MQPTSDTPFDQMTIVHKTTPIHNIHDDLSDFTSIGLTLVMNNAMNKLN